MHYKTIVLELLQQRTALYEHLRKERLLLKTITVMAAELRSRHLALIEVLSQANPGSNDSVISSQAMEIAVQGMKDYLSSGSDEEEALSLDQAMAYINNRMSKD